MLIWASLSLLFSSNLNLYLPITVERTFFFFFLLSHFYSCNFYRFHQIKLVRLAALSTEMELTGGPSGSCFVYSNSAVFDLNIFPGVWTR